MDYLCEEKLWDRADKEHIPLQDITKDIAACLRLSSERYTITEERVGYNWFDYDFPIALKRILSISIVLCNIHENSSCHPACCHNIFMHTYDNVK